MLRTRALSAVVIVLPLLIALAIGTPALAVFLAIVVALGAWEAFRLLRMAGYSSLHVFGTVLAVAMGSRPAAATCPDTPTARVPGTAADRVAACRRAETGDGAAIPGMGTRGTGLDQP